MIVVVVWEERIHAFHADDAVVSWDNMRTLNHAGAYFKHIQREERKMDWLFAQSWKVYIFVTFIYLSLGSVRPSCRVAYSLPIQINLGSYFFTFEVNEQQCFIGL